MTRLGIEPRSPRPLASTPEFEQPNMKLFRLSRGEFVLQNEMEFFSGAVIFITKHVFFSLFSPFLVHLFIYLPINLFLSIYLSISFTHTHTHTHTHIYIYIYIYIYSYITNNDGSNIFTNFCWLHGVPWLSLSLSLSPSIPITYCSWQVLSPAFCVRSDLMYIRLD